MVRKSLLVPSLTTVALIATACAPGIETPTMIATSMTVTSTAFAEGEAIPSRHTCDADDVSPPLAWSGAPEETAAFAIVVDDPDAGGWVHWILADIPPGTVALDQGAAAGLEGTTDFGRAGWGGPCPPSGSHRYVFEVFALSDSLDLEPGFDADALRAAIDGKVLASGRLTGTYRRGG